MPTTRPHLLQVVLDATDVRGLAEFYRELLGMEYRPGDEPDARGADPQPDWLVLRADSGMRVAFQWVDALPRNTWPQSRVPQQLHLDMVMDDAATLEHWRSWAIDHGATELLDRTDDPDEPLVVLSDPAGHPFCLFVG